jgi:peroxiredoxin Q/BCP
VGVSADSAQTQLKFIDKFGLEFPMIPDPDKHIIDAWGVRKIAGVTAQRSTFLVDPDGKIARVWPKVSVEGHADDVVETIRSLASRWHSAGGNPGR